MSDVPSGWYPDPQGLADERYYDGTDWTNQTRIAAASRPTAVPAASRPTAVPATAQYPKFDQNDIKQINKRPASLVSKVIAYILMVPMLLTMGAGLITETPSWFILTAVLLCAVIIVALVGAAISQSQIHRDAVFTQALTSQSPSTKPVGNTKPCPYCGETILEVAIKCKHCQERLTS